VRDASRTNDLSYTVIVGASIDPESVNINATISPLRIRHLVLRSMPSSVSGVRSPPMTFTCSAVKARSTWIRKVSVDLCYRDSLGRGLVSFNPADPIKRATRRSKSKGAHASGHPTPYNVRAIKLNNVARLLRRETIVRIASDRCCYGDGPHAQFVSANLHESYILIY